MREDRLIEELHEMEHLRELSSLIDFETRGDPPDEYMIIYRCIGLIAPDIRSSEHLVHMYLHTEFPWQPPEVYFLTPIFHPNIVSPIQLATVQSSIQLLLAMSPDEAARNQLVQELLRNPDMYKGRVCLDSLELNWSPTISLMQICLELGEMIQYKRSKPDHPLNPEAAEWAYYNQHLLPIDRRTLCDLQALETIKIVSVSSSDEPDVDIRVV